MRMTQVFIVDLAREEYVPYRTDMILCSLTMIHTHTHAFTPCPSGIGCADIAASKHKVAPLALSSLAVHLRRFHNAVQVFHRNRKLPPVTYQLRLTALLPMVPCYLTICYFLEHFQGVAFALRLNFRSDSLLLGHKGGKGGKGENCLFVLTMCASYSQWLNLV